MLRLFGKTFSSKDLQMMAFLRRDRLFEDLTDRELSHLLPNIHERTFQQDEVVFFSGDPSQAMYIVKTGMVALNIDLKDSFEKLMTVRAGKIFGDNSLLANSKRIYTAVVVSERCSLYVIPRVNLLEVMDSSPVIRAKVMTKFCENYNEYTARLFRAYRTSLGFFDLHRVYSKVD
jgi:CRP/FNR family transcriptional regulator, cyclic AMP receptor protein